MLIESKWLNFNKLLSKHRATDFPPKNWKRTYNSCILCSDCSRRGGS